MKLEKPLEKEYLKALKTIHTLIPDVYQLLEDRNVSVTDVVASELSSRIESGFKSRLRENQDEPRGTLRLSKMGPSCPRALWYSVHHPELREALPAWTVFKFTYGDVIEALAIALAKIAGHTIEGEQHVVELDGIQGHLDCIIDGCIVDIKSTSSRSFNKFKNKTIAQDDSFGYLDQLDGYLVGSLSNDLVKVKDRAYLWAIDKQLGHMVLYEHKIREQRIRSRITDYREIVARALPPACECGTISYGMSGNIGLDTKASYSGFKHSCFPNIRTFLYKDGPVFLTKVIRRPDVPELLKDGTVLSYG